MTTAQFKVGDKVMSAMDSGDRVHMENVYRGTIARVRGNIQGAPDGRCYIIHGQWDKDNYDEGITSRQLWANHMEIDNGN